MEFGGQRSPEDEAVPTKHRDVRKAFRRGVRQSGERFCAVHRASQRANSKIAARLLVFRRFIAHGQGCAGSSFRDSGVKKSTGF